MMNLPPTQERALVELYTETLGESWSHKEGWLGEGSPCGWYGITCEGDRITRLDLRDNRLSGAIPASLGFLINLTYLDLSHNHLHGLIPPNLGHLRHLRVLDLSENELRGSIPARLQLLSQLRLLDLHGNHLSGLLPVGLGDLVRLEHLDLSDNELTGEVPPALGKLRHLIDLSLSRNPLWGPLPLELTGLAALESFSFIGTELLERSQPAFQSWLQGLAHLESTGTLYAEVVERGNVALAALAGAGTLGAALASAFFLLPLVGPVASVVAAVAGAAGTGLVAKKVYELTEAPSSVPSLPAPTASPPALTNADQLRQELRYLVRTAQRELPEDIVMRVEDIERSLLKILPRLRNLDSDRDAYVARQTVREYLPEALDNYRALPRKFAITEPLRGGKTAHELLLRQLEILHRALQGIEEGLPYEDAQRLLIHGRFLEHKFDELGEELPGPFQKNQLTTAKETEQTPLDADER